MKIFCLGSNKTGTVSLTTAMKMLGYTTHNSAQGLYVKANKDIKVFFDLFIKHTSLSGKKLDTFDFYVDIPFSLGDNYKFIYKLFPNASFILTIRNPEKWFDTVLRWIKLNECWHAYCQIWSTNFVQENKVEIINKYNKRNSDIISFFKKNRNFLPLYIDKDKDNLQKLCVFLNKDIIEGPFPHKNKNQIITKT